MEYIPWDFKYFAKLRGNQILEDMQPVIRSSLDATGMFVCPPSSPSPEANRNAVSSWVRALSLWKGSLNTSHLRKRRSMALYIDAAFNLAYLTSLQSLGADRDACSWKRLLGRSHLAVTVVTQNTCSDLMKLMPS